MTERFTIKPQDDLFGVVDNYSADKVCVVNGIRTEIEAKWLCDLMNELNNENINIKKQLNEECENCIYYSHKKVMTVINDAIATERTSIGKSVLRQLKEQIT